MAMHHELNIHKQAYELLSIATDLTRNIPRDLKQGLGTAVRDECVALLVLIARANAAMLTLKLVRDYAAPVTVNPVIGFGDSDYLADKAAEHSMFAAFLSAARSCVLVGLGGETFGSAGFQVAGSPTLLNPATRRLATLGGGFNPILGVIKMTNTARNPSAVSVFNFQSNDVRTVLRDGEPWFVASDVCRALGYRDADKGTRILGTHQKGTQIVPTPGGDQRLTIINESGLYRLVLRSRKPEAVAFSDWVTGEVLPSIRKTGAYAVPTIDATELALSALKRTRFLCWFDDGGKPQLKPVGESACVVRTDDEVSVMTFIREFLPLESVPAAIEICAQRIMNYHAFQNRVARAAAGGAK